MVDNIVLQNQTLQIENLYLFVLAELHFFCLVFAHISVEKKKNNYCMNRKL